MTTTNRFTTGAGAYARLAVINAVRAVRAGLDDILGRVDEWLCTTGFDLDDDDLEPCVCGSTDHQSVRVAFTSTEALLQNGQFGSLPVGILFSYDESEPMAVTMRVTLMVDVDGDCVGHDEQSWQFSRDILDTAMSTEDESVIGEGDVAAQYIPTQSDVWLWLTDAQGHKHRLDVDAHAITEFLEASFHLVPHGEETADVDDEDIAKLIDGTWEQ